MCDGIIMACLAALLIIGGVSFFCDPRYEKGVWIVLAAVSHLLSAAAGAKFALAVPRFGIGIREEKDGNETKTPGNPTGSDADNGPSYRVGFAPSVNRGVAKGVGPD